MSDYSVRPPDEYAVLMSTLCLKLDGGGERACRYRLWSRAGMPSLGCGSRLRAVCESCQRICGPDLQNQVFHELEQWPGKRQE